jgi:hypothetical protein
MMVEMTGWFHWLVRRASRVPGTLQAVPPVRRQKNYMAISGYAYEYFFEGRRDRRNSREYVFTVSADRKIWFTLNVELPAASLRAWEDCHRRALADNERYALVKLSLFEAFDAAESPASMPHSFTVTPQQAEELLGRIDL